MGFQADVRRQRGASRRPPAVGLWTLCGALALASASAQAQVVPLGSDFQVNSYTTSSQDFPTVAAAVDRSFVVVWKNWADGEGLRGRRFAADGSPLVGEFVVAPATSQASLPEIAATDDGGYYVVWQYTSGAPQLRGRVLNSTGTPSGGVIDLDPGPVGSPGVDAAEGGPLMATWSGPGAGGFTVWVSRVSQTGALEGARIPIAPGGAHDLSVDPSGAFTVAWTQASEGRSSQVQRFSSEGAPVGEQIVLPEPHSYQADNELAREPASGLWS